MKTMALEQRKIRLQQFINCGNALTALNRYYLYEKYDSDKANTLLNLRGTYNRIWKNPGAVRAWAIKAKTAIKAM